MKVFLRGLRALLRNGKVGNDAACCESKCCGGEARTEPGDCCGNIWYPAPEGEPSPDRTATPFTPIVWQSDKCPEGHVYALWGRLPAAPYAWAGCCGCIPDEIWDPRIGEYVPTETVIADLCCDRCVTGSLSLKFNEYGVDIGCLGRCCADDDCSRLHAHRCAAGIHPTNPDATRYVWSADGCCETDPCLVECCGLETATFPVTGTVCPGNQWVLAVGEASYAYTVTEAGTRASDVASELADIVSGPFSAIASGSSVIVTGPDAGDGTITRSCGEPQPPTSIVTAKVPPSECAAQEGEEKVGGVCPCNPGDVCCERATSSGVSLTFTKPAAFTGAVRVTITGSVDSPILIHGVPAAAGAINHTFTLCYGTFNIEAETCNASMNNLRVKVCYEEEAETVEAFDFSGCNGLQIALSNCAAGCTTTMTYDGAGHTSNSTIQVWGDATIDASGTGPLVLTSNITVPGGCAETLTLTGTNTAANEISGSIGDSAAGLGIQKTGVGTWRLAGNNSFSEQLQVRAGTLVVGGVPSTGNSPFGSGVDASALPRIGDSSASSGTAALLTTGTVNRGFFVESGSGQVVILGGTGGGSPRFESTLPVRLGRGVTLQASTGGTVAFANNWLDLDDGYEPAVGFVVGSSGNAGTVVLESFLPISATEVSVRYGTLRLDYSDEFGGPIWYETPVTLGDTDTQVTLEVKGIDQALADLSFVGPGSDITGPDGGTLTLSNSPTVTASGSGHEISAPVVLADNATFAGTGDLLISGVVSGEFDLTMDGSGTVTLSGDNTYTGTTTINSGTMKAGSLTAFGTGDIVVEAGGTLDKNGFALVNTITNNDGTVIP